MSAKGLATLAIVRDKRAPLKGDLGKAANSEEAKEPPSNVDILSSALPTGLVGAYTTYVASITALVEKPTLEDPTPDTYEGYLWIGLAVLVILAIGFVLKHYWQKGGKGVPPGEVAVAAIASIGWGLAIPESPLAVARGDDYSPAAPILIAFMFAGLVLLITNRGLQKARK